MPGIARPLYFFLFVSSFCCEKHVFSSIITLWLAQSSRVQWGSIQTTYSSSLLVCGWVSAWALPQLSLFNQIIAVRVDFFLCMTKN